MREITLLFHKMTFCHSLSLSLSLSQPFVVYIMMQRYLQAQSLVWVFVLIAILMNVINIIFASLFIYGADQPIM